MKWPFDIIFYTAVLNDEGSNCSRTVAVREGKEYTLEKVTGEVVSVEDSTPTGYHAVKTEGDGLQLFAPRFFGNIDLVSDEEEEFGRYLHEPSPLEPTVLRNFHVEDDDEIVQGVVALMVDTVEEAASGIFTRQSWEPSVFRNGPSTLGLYCSSYVVVHLTGYTKYFVHGLDISFLVKTECDGMQLFAPQVVGATIDLVSEEDVEPSPNKVIVTPKDHIEDEDRLESAVSFPEDLAKENATSELCLSSTATEVSGLYCYAYFLADRTLCGRWYDSHKGYFIFSQNGRGRNANV